MPGPDLLSQKQGPVRDSSHLELFDANLRCEYGVGRDVRAPC